MRWGLVLCLAFACSPSFAAEPPAWAFPITEKVQPPAPPDDGKPKTMPGSKASFTQAQINDSTNPPDWYPDEHPPMPEVVGHGRKEVRACATCHLPNGLGHPESANLAGLPAAYIERQLADFKSGKRKGSDIMASFAKAMSPEETKAAAAYFASLKPTQWTRVVETDAVPQTYVGKGNMRFVLPGGAQAEAIAGRIIELPEDAVRAEARDGHSGFVANVPKGSIAKGEALAKQGGGGKTIACAICHGPDLRGLGEVPRIAGRSAIYLVRQLALIQSGERASEQTALMQAVVKQLSMDDMVALAAYVAAQAP
jgi:cytochrome c553